MSDAGTARAAATGWMATNRSPWPGLRAAHLVGSITTLPDCAPDSPSGTARLGSTGTTATTTGRPRLARLWCEPHRCTARPSSTSR